MESPELKEWYYAENGITLGPISWDDLLSKFQKKEVLISSHIWSEGMSDWAPADQILPSSRVQSLCFVPPPSNPQFNPINSRCPYCSFEGTQTIKLAVQTGTQQGLATSVGITTNGRVGVGNTYMNLQSDLARKYSPGNAPSPALGILICLPGIGGFLLFLVAYFDSNDHQPLFLIIALGFLALIFIGISQIRNIPKESALWRERVNTFERGWLCLRCGRDWVPSSPQKSNDYSNA